VSKPSNCPNCKKGVETTSMRAKNILDATLIEIKGGSLEHEMHPDGQTVGIG
jgi:hypothetical protein